MANETLSGAQRDAWRAMITAHARSLDRIEAALAAEQLPPAAWYDVLCALQRSPERELRMFELADEVVMSRSGLTRLVDRLEAVGAVRRETCANDRRGAYVVLTDEGDAIFRGMVPVYERAIAESFAAPLGEGAADLTRLLAPVLEQRRARRPAATRS